MMYLGLLIILGAVLDIIVDGYSTIHILLFACGLLVLIVNIIGEKFLKGIAGRFGKTMVSGIILVAAALILAGLFAFEGTATSAAAADAINKADKLILKENYLEAENVLQKANEENGWRKDINLKLGYLYKAQNENDKALSRFYDVMANDSVNVESRYCASLVLTDKKDYSGAIKQLQYISKIEPHNSGIYKALGDCYWFMGDSIRGILYYKLAVEEDDKSLENRVALANAYAEMHSYEEAGIEYKAAFELADEFEEELMIIESYDRMSPQTDKQGETGQEVAE